MTRTRIGSLIRQERERRGWSQEDLARTVPCHRALISKWERGLAEPDAMWVMRLALAMNSAALREEAIRMAFRPAERVLALRYMRRNVSAQSREAAQAA